MDAERTSFVQADFGGLLVDVLGRDSPPFESFLLIWNVTLLRVKETDRETVSRLLY